MSTRTTVIRDGTSGALIRGSKMQIVFQLIVIGMLVLLVVNYKGMAGISKIRQTHSTGSLRLPALQNASGTPIASSLRDTGSYLKIVWPALVFGILISATVRTSLTRTPLQAVFGNGNVRDQLTGALAGVPLMLCSCCVAPIFPSIYQKTRRIGPALALALAAPSLNPVALTLSFILFPWRVAGGRLAMALILVLIGSAFVARITQPSGLSISPDDRAYGDGWSDLFVSYAKSLAYITLRTVPLIIVGICASMWVLRYVPLNQPGITAGGHLLAILIMALIALLLTLPSLFEIPLALSILAAGAPLGAAAAVLFAGPALNLPSLLVIGRNSSWKVAFALAGVVWLIAAVGGLLIR